MVSLTYEVFHLELLQGMRKHKLLIEDILPAMASNRKVQRLLNEFMDLVSEYEIADTNQDQRNPVLPKTSSHVTNQTESGSLSLATHVKDTAPPKSDQNNPRDADIDGEHIAKVAKINKNSTPHANEASEASVHDQVVLDTPDQE